ncbi:MAG: hypothetical protein NVS4B7_11010 [Ktedonobacteraceae bacterium]
MIIIATGDKKLLLRNLKSFPLLGEDVMGAIGIFIDEVAVIGEMAADILPGVCVRNDG